MKTRTVILTGIGALTAGLLAVVALRTEPMPVDLVEVARGPMRVSVDVEGKTRIAEIYEVSAPVSGTAQRAPVRVGDAVEAGRTVVAVVTPAAPTPLDPRSRVQAEAAVREAEAGLEVARSAMAQAEEELALAQSEFRRAGALVERGVATLTRLETAEQQLAIRQAATEAARSGLALAQGTLDRARAALIEPGVSGSMNGCCLEITAPVDGRVLEVDVLSERPVSAGTRLLSIGQPDDLEIVADILSTDAVRLAPGVPAIVERWGGPRPLEARISRIEPSAYTKVSALGIEEQRVDVIFDLLSPPEDRPALGDGFSVFLRVIEWQGEDVLQLPLGALFRHDGGWAVFVVDDGRARLRAVKTGRSNSETIEVLDGLAAGERVILHPGARIADGVKIVEREAG